MYRWFLLRKAEDGVRNGKKHKQEYRAIEGHPPLEPELSVGIGCAELD